MESGNNPKEFFLQGDKKASENLTNVQFLLVVKQAWKTAVQLQPNTEHTGL